MSYPFDNVISLLLTTAALSGVIGYYIRSVWTNKYIVELEEYLKEEMDKRLKGRDRYITQLKYELNDAEEGLSMQSDALQKSLQNKSDNARDQKDKLDQYLIRMNSAENKLISLQRTYIIFKAQKQKEVDQLKAEYAAQAHKDEEFDMDATLELDERMREEENPFVLRNALINEQRKVEQISFVTKELNETYLRFAKEKQIWMREKQNLKDRLKAFEQSDVVSVK